MCNARNASLRERGRKRYALERCDARYINDEGEGSRGCVRGSIKSRLRAGRDLRGNWRTTFTSHPSHRVYIRV